MYWRVKRYWPHAAEYSAQQFAQQPVHAVVDAIAQGNRLYFEELHHQELGLATLIACFINANRSPKKSKPVEPSDFYLFGKATKSLPSAACNVFFDLVNSKQMPRWAIGVAPVKKMQEARNSVPPSRPRAWIGDGAVLLQPSATKTTVTAQVALLASTQKRVTVTDIDSGDRYTIELPDGLVKVRAYSVRFECNLRAKQAKVIEDNNRVPRI